MFIDPSLALRMTDAGIQQTSADAQDVQEDN